MPIASCSPERPLLSSTPQKKAFGAPRLWWCGEWEWLAMQAS